MLKDIFNYKSEDFTAIPFMIAVIILMLLVLVVNNTFIKIGLAFLQAIILAVEIALVVKNAIYFKEQIRGLKRQINNER